MNQNDDHQARPEDDDDIRFNEALDYFGDMIEGTCKVCGCTDSRACRGGCYWVESDLCSVCAAKELSR